MKKIGILHGKENTFPPALVDAINAKKVAGIVAEPVCIDKLVQGEPSGYAVIIDRISQDVPFYRAYLKNAALNGTAVINNPFWWSADEKFFNNCLATKIGVAVPKTVLLPSKEHPPDTGAEVLPQPGLSAGLGGDLRLRRLPGLLQAAFRRRLEERLQGERPARISSRSTRETGQLVMLLQEEIKFDRVLPLLRPRLPGRADHALRPAAAAPPALRASTDPTEDQDLIDLVADRRRCSSSAAPWATTSTPSSSRCATACRTPSTSATRRPTPTAHSVGEENFDWVLEAAANMAIRQRPGARSRARTTSPGASSSARSRPPRAEAGSGHSRRMSEAKLLHARDRGRVPAHRSRDARPALAHPGDLRRGQGHPRDQLKPEMHQSVVEVGTRVCADIQRGPRARSSGCARQLAAVARGQRPDASRAAGTHPFARWQDQQITLDPRYDEIVEDLQQVARANLIFGLHVHVGIDDREIAIHIMNAARYFLPHIFALSTNSPFWEGRNTGFKSYRSQDLRPLPAHRHPGLLLQRLASTTTTSSCWSRPAASTTPRRSGGTSACTRSSTPWSAGSATCRCGSRRRIALAALMQAVTAKLYKLIKLEPGLPALPPAADQREQVARRRATASTAS